MLIFRSEEHIERWCTFRGLPRGGAMSPQQRWQLAQAWYGDKVSADWRRKTVDEAEAMLADIGRTDPFWSPRLSDRNRTRQQAIESVSRTVAAEARPSARSVTILDSSPGYHRQVGLCTDFRSASR